MATGAASPDLRRAALAARPAFLQVDDDRATQNLRVFDAVWTLIDRRFYDPAKTGASWDDARAKYRAKAIAAETVPALYDTVLGPMLHELGVSHVQAEMPAGTKYFDAQRPQPRIFIVGRGENFCRPAGFDCVRIDGRLVVVGVPSGSAAAAGGVVPGAVVTSMSIGSTRSGSTKVRLSQALQDGVASPVEYEFSKVARPDKSATLVRPGVLLVRFDSFDHDSVDWARAQIEAAAPKAVVLDFRHNHGGSVAASKRFMSVFLPRGASLGRNVTARGRVEERVASGTPYFYRGELAVLVGPFSNSAAEIAAAVFRHHGRACLVGARTAGNVLTARTFDLPDGGELQIPIKAYETPAGVSLEGVGVAPDIDGADTPESVRRGVDRALEEAVKALEDERCGEAAPLRQAQASLVAQ